MNLKPSLNVGDFVVGAVVGMIILAIHTKFVAPKLAKK